MDGKLTVSIIRGYQKKGGKCLSETRLQENIEMYLSVVNEIRDSINVIQGKRYIENHKKTLLFSVIDMLSKGVYGNRLGNNRTTMFEKFILEFCAWENAQRISLQQLVHLLDKTEEGKFSRLKDFAKTELYQYPDSQPVPFSYDPTYKRLKELMPKGETTILGVELKSLSHVSLLWKLRNSLVHEARSKGGTKLFDDDVQPHYVHYSTFGTDDEGNLIVTKETWEMYHPVGFFNKMIDIALTNVRTYLEAHSINPYDNYDFDPLWVEVRRND
ncbi:hypothetical protein [Bacillus rhizoplanae]|uniref:hypothetical protein n=1 Tax=Bacillus rhizoplanae TaxID=2880966 RepID=UPI003D1D4089